MLKLTFSTFLLIIGACLGAATIIVLPDFPRSIFGQRWDIIESSEGQRPQFQGEIKKTKTEGILLMARAAVQGALNDPYSAKFDSMTLHEKGGHAVVVCGLVNAKNGFGAYVGPTPFVYHQMLDMAMIGPKGSDIDAVSARARIAAECSDDAAPAASKSKGN